VTATTTTTAEKLYSLVHLQLYKNKYKKKSIEKCKII